MKKKAALIYSLLLCVSSSLLAMNSQEEEEAGPSSALAIPVQKKEPILQSNFCISEEEWKNFNAVFGCGARDGSLYESFSERARHQIGQEASDHIARYRQLYQEITTTKLQKLEKNYQKKLKKLAELVSGFEGRINDIVNQRNHVPTFDFTPYRPAFTVLQKSYEGLISIHKKMTHLELDQVGPLAYQMPYTFIQMRHATTYAHFEILPTYLFYHQDEKGKYWIFTLDGTQPIGETGYCRDVGAFLIYSNQKFEEYVFLSQRAPNGTPILETRPGIILTKNPMGYQIEKYNGAQHNYKGGSVYAILNSLRYKTYMACQDIQDHLETLGNATQKNENLKTRLQETPQQLPRVNPVSMDTPSLPDVSISSHTFNSLCEKILAGQEETFIPFPGTSPLKKAEETYLYLRAKQKERRKKQKASGVVGPDAPLFYFVHETSDASAPLKEEVTLEVALQGCKEDLLSVYRQEAQNAIEEEIRAQQAQVSRDVAEGKRYASSKKSSAPHKSRVSQKKQQPIAPSPEEIKAETHKRAKQKLQELKKQKGSFRELLNVAMQEFEKLKRPMTISLKHGSHGTLQIGDQKKTLVIPHGAQENSIPYRTETAVMSFIMDNYLDALLNSALSSSAAP